MIVPLVIMFFVIGLYPNLLLDHIVPAVEILLP
jgi:NADH:ubiquinone oxidoreductase subunit 4 (subunit M)